MRILFICGFGFPVGYSGSNRLVSLSKGLIEAGAEVHVRVLFPTEHKENKVNQHSEGSYEGVFYQYPYKRTHKLKNFIYKKIDIVFSTLFSLFKIHKEIRKYDVIINTYDVPLFVFALSFIKFKDSGTNLLFIVDEYPPEIRYGKNESNQISGISKFLFRHSLKKIDGLISMTDSLIDFYRPYIQNKPCLKLPITVELDRFQKVPPNNNFSKYIAYIGNFDNAKDGLDDLVQSYSKVIKKYPNIDLYLAGEGSAEDMTFVKSLVNRLGLENKVKFLGRMHRESVPEFLMNANLLAMSRPASFRNEGGFPTKLGEYLATGVPTVVTDIGEITLYLQDQVSVFLAKPNNVDSFAEKIIMILDDYNKALDVAREGQIIALNEFSYKPIGIRFKTFLDEL